MDLVHHVINYLGSIPDSTWTSLAAYLGGSTVIATILQFVKHKFNFADAKKLLVVAMGGLSFVASLADFLIQTNATNPLPTIGHMTGLLMAGAVVMHRFAVSPAYYGLTKRITNLSSWLDKVAAYQADQKTAQKANTATVVKPSVPASELPDEANLAQFEVK